MCPPLYSIVQIYNKMVYNTFISNNTAQILNCLFCKIFLWLFKRVNIYWQHFCWWLGISVWIWAHRSSLGHIDLTSVTYGLVFKGSWIQSCRYLQILDHFSFKKLFYSSHHRCKKATGANREKNSDIAVIQNSNGYSFISKVKNIELVNYLVTNL